MCFLLLSSVQRSQHLSVSSFYLPKQHATFLWLLCYLTKARKNSYVLMTSLIRLGPHGQPRIISFIRSLLLFTPAKFLLASKKTYSQVRGIRRWLPGEGWHYSACCEGLSNIFWYLTCHSHIFFGKVSIKHFDHY